MNSSKDYFDRLATFSSEIRKLTLKRLEEVPEGFVNWQLNCKGSLTCTMSKWLSK